MVIDKYLHIKASLVGRYLFYFLIILLSGYFLRSLLFILPISIYAYMCYKNKIENIVLFIVFWSFIYNYFIGQAWITNGFIIKFLLKPNIYILLTWLFFRDRLLPATVLSKKVLFWIIGMSIILVLNDVFLARITTNAITYSVSIILFYLILRLAKSKLFNKRLLNLLVAIGFLQIILSIFQVSGLIQSPLRGINETYTASYESGLDDAATGSMGTNQSNVTSWLCTVLLLFFLSNGFLTQRIYIVFFSFLFISHYVTVDSKTALGLTIAGILYLILKLSNTLVKHPKSFLIVSTVALLLYGTYKLVDNYYTNLVTNEGIEGRFEAVGNTYNLINDNRENWGKIAGFVNLTKDFRTSGKFDWLFGYGLGNYNLEIKNQDIQAMKGNNVLASVSTFIRMYAELGLLGILSLFALFHILRSDLNHRHFETVVGKSFAKSGIVILDVTIVFMFLYGGLTIRDLAFSMLLLIYALIIRHEDEYSTIIQTSTLSPRNIDSHSTGMLS